MGAFLFFVKKPSTIVSTATSEVGSMPISTSFDDANTVAAERTDFVAAAGKSLNAVVHVKNTSEKNIRDPFAEFFYGRSEGRKYRQVGTGSGVLISLDGYIITNNHVIENATEIEITLNTKKTYKAELIGSDPTNDIALLKIEGKEFDYIPFGNSDHLHIGEWVLAVGNRPVVLGARSLHLG